MDLIEMFMVLRAIIHTFVRFLPLGLYSFAYLSTAVFKDKLEEQIKSISPYELLSYQKVDLILKASGKFDQYPIPLEVDGDDVPLAKYSHARAEKYLNIKFTPVEQTIIDGAQSIADMLK